MSPIRRLLHAAVELATSAALATGLVTLVFVLIRLLDTVLDEIAASTNAAATTFGPVAALTHLACVALGAVLLHIIQVVRDRAHARKALPPATARQIARAARANRLEVRKPTPRWIPLSETSFDDDEETK